MADEEGNAQLLAQAENSSLSGLSRDFSVLYEARGSGDVVFKFPAEGDELEERAHRLILGVRSKYFAALMARMDISADVVITDFSYSIFQHVLKWVYTGAMPTAETQDDLHELLRAANFLTLSELVHTVVARVAVSMEPETAVPWLLLAEEGTLGEFDETLKMTALACLLSLATTSSAPSHYTPEVLALLRGALLRCSPAERTRLRLSFLKVVPGDADAPRWAAGAVPLLASPRSPARRPVTFINMRDAPIDIIWIAFDGQERRYIRAQDNVDSRIQPGRSTSWSSVVGHMWRIYDAGSHAWLGAVEVELPAPPVPSDMLSFDELLRRVSLTGMQPLPPPIGKLAKSSDANGHQIFLIA